MANQENFKTDVTSNSAQFAKYTVSRIISNLSDDLLRIEAPADFPVDLNGYNVQINVYSLADNSLIYTAAISNEKNPGALYTESLWYTDGSVRQLLFVDFSKIVGLNLPLGQVSITLNFFKNEVGSLDQPVLKVSQISLTRQEVELELTDGSKINELTTFADPYISAQHIQDAIKQIFNQPNSSTLNSYTTGSRVTSESIAAQFTGSVESDLIKYGFDTGSNLQPGVYQVAQTVLNNAYQVVFTRVAQDLEKNTGSFSSTYLNKIVQDAIRSEYVKVVGNQPYRFILL